MEEMARQAFELWRLLLGRSEGEELGDLEELVRNAKWSHRDFGVH